MNFETFQHLCEVRAVRFFTDLGSNFDSSKIDSYVEKLADDLASKHSDYLAYFEIAQEAVKAVLNNPSRYKKVFANRLQLSSRARKTTADSV